MAKGQFASKTVVVNNKPSTTITKTIELIVKDGALVADNNDIHPGVNSATNQN